MTHRLSHGGQRSTRQAVAWLVAALGLAGLLVGCEDRSSAPPGERPAPATEPAAAPATAAPKAVPPAPKPAAPLAADVTCSTAECHPRFSTSRFVHGPVASGACAACHQDDAGGHHYPLRRQGNETCTFCHGVVAGSRSHQHEALKEGCTACHDPHASGAKFLLAAPTVERVCAKCHDIPLKKYAHEPFAAGDCTVCHEPHQANSKKLLRGGEGPEHCFMCHADMRKQLANSSHVHKPATEDCVTCHSPHTTDQPHQLKLAMEETCFSCHKNLEESVKLAAAPHAAVFTADRCANCHDPHASGRPALLSARQEEVCLKCHDKPVAATDGHTIPDMKPTLTARQYLHGPVKAGECAACHNAHGAGNANLLRKTFNKSFYASFDLENFALCFSCHDKALVLEEKTASLTNFRNGDRNLHFLHVNRETKGRTCKACHAIHGSDLPNHIASDVAFEGSQWAMPIKYEKTIDGGRCMPGCHGPQGYGRREPITPPATQQAGGAP